MFCEVSKSSRNKFRGYFNSELEASMFWMQFEDKHWAD